MASINESNVTSLYFKSSTTCYRMFMHASMNNLFSLCMPIWWTFFFTRWNVVIKKRGKEGSSKKYVLYICFTHKFHLFRLIGKCHEIFIRYNDYSIDPSIVRIAFYLFFSSYLTKLVIFCKFFYIYFMLYINFILSLKSNTVSKFKQLIKRYKESENDFARLNGIKYHIDWISWFIHDLNVKTHAKYRGEYQGETSLLSKLLSLDKYRRPRHEPISRNLGRAMVGTFSKSRFTRESQE